MLSKDHDGSIICGKRKQGKTTLLKALYRNEKRVMLYDAKGDLKEPMEVQTGRLLKRIWSDKGILRAFVPRNTQSPAEELEWSAFCSIHMGNCVYVVDELPDALEDGEPEQAFKWVTRMGRMRDIRFIYSFQRPAEVPRMVTANASDWYLFQNNERNDMLYIAQCISKEAAEEMKNLPKHHYLHCRDGRVLAIGKADL